MLPVYPTHDNYLDIFSNPLKLFEAFRLVKPLQHTHFTSEAPT